MNSTPLIVFAHLVDDRGAEVGDAFMIHEAFALAQVGDHIDFLGPENVEGWDKWPGKYLIVRERQFTTYRRPIGHGACHGATLTLFVRRS